jgi:hypothetical protein
MFNRGGQRRTIEAGCGWRCVGHPQEVNKKYLIHKRYCNDCGESEYDAPEFNKEGANMNGWKGVNIKQNVPNKMLTTAFINGVRQDIMLDGITNMEDAMDEARLVAGLTNPKPLSKSQKKRQKQKSKKNTEPLIKPFHIEEEEDIGVKQELLAGATYMYVPPDKLEEFLNNAEGRDHNEKELVDLLMKYMPFDKVELLMSELEK